MDYLNKVLHLPGQVEDPLVSFGRMSCKGEHCPVLPLSTHYGHPERLCLCLSEGDVGMPDNSSDILSKEG